MLKIRRPLGRLIFNMGIAIPGKTVFLIDTAPWSAWRYLHDGIMTWKHFCFTLLGVVSLTFRNPSKIISKLYNARNHIYGENFKLKLCMCAQSFGHTYKILLRSMISPILKFQENILESSWNVSETPPWSLVLGIYWSWWFPSMTLQWRHNECDGDR